MTANATTTNTITTITVVFVVVVVVVATANNGQRTYFRVPQTQLRYVSFAFLHLDYCKPSASHRISVSTWAYFVAAIWTRCAFTWKPKSTFVQHILVLTNDVTNSTNLKFNTTHSSLISFLLCSLHAHTFWPCSLLHFICSGWFLFFDSEICFVVNKQT